MTNIDIMKRQPHLFIIVPVIIIIISALLYVVFVNDASVVEMTANQWNQEVTEYKYPDFNFPNLKSGDTVLVTGIIVQIGYLPDNNITWFYLDDNTTYPFHFDGNITSIYNESDTVRITISIGEGQIFVTDGKYHNGEILEGYTIEPATP